MKTYLTKLLIFVVLFSTILSIISYVAAIEDSTNYSPLLKDASKNKELFDKYVKDVLNVNAKIDLLPEAKMEETSTLVNPKGGKLNLNSLGKDVVSVKMLDKGGFSFKRKNNEGKEEELDLKGFDKVNYDEKTGHYVADGVELQSEAGKGTFEKTKEGIKAKGQAKLFLEGKQYSIATEQGVEFKIKEEKLQSFSVTGQKDKPVFVYIGNDKVDVSRGTFTYFGDKTLYDSANTNKMMKQDKQFFVSQNQDGALSLNDYYYLDNGKLKVSAKGLFNPPETKLSYNYGSKSVETPTPISKENAAGYSSVGDLFKDYGYGSGNANKDARKAFYEKVFHGEKYTYSGEQNQKLLGAISSGKANLYRAGEVDYEHNLNGYSKIQSDAANNPVVKKTPAVTFIDQKMVTDYRPIQSTTDSTSVIQGVTQVKPVSGKASELKNILTRGMKPWEIVNNLPPGVKPLETLNTRTSFYYDAIPGDYGQYKSFRSAVKTEGDGIGYDDDGKLVHYYVSNGRVVSENIDPNDNLQTFEVNKRGRRAEGVKGTKEVGDFAVPPELYDKYKGHVAYMKIDDGRYIKGRIADRGSKIQLKSLSEDDTYSFAPSTLPNYLVDSDVYLGVGASTQNNLGGLGKNMLKNKYDYKKLPVKKQPYTQLIISDEIDRSMVG